MSALRFLMLRGGVLIFLFVVIMGLVFLFALGDAANCDPTPLVDNAIVKRVVEKDFEGVRVFHFAAALQLCHAFNIVISRMHFAPLDRMFEKDGAVSEVAAVDQDGITNHFVKSAIGLSESHELVLFHDGWYVLLTF